MNKKLKPDWAGKDMLSQFVNLLIHIKPIYQVMKHQARQVIIKTAEKMVFLGVKITKNLRHPQYSTTLMRLEILR